MESKNKKFHFRELDWIICFPTPGNERKKYADYTVAFQDRKAETPQNCKHVNLGEVLERLEIENNYPHTVGFYKASSEKEPDLNQSCLEIRRIKTVEDFWKFLNDLDL